MRLLGRGRQRGAARSGCETGQVDIATGINVRELGGFPTPSGTTRYRRFLRSGSTARISPSDARELFDYGVRRILDLRGKEEVANSPESLLSLRNVEYLNVPLYDFDISAGVLAHEDDAGGYLTENLLSMLENRAAFRQIFTFLAHAPRSACTLFHCGAGSDRTGLLSLVLLGLAGVERRQLVADYVYSFGYIPEVNAAIFERVGEGARTLQVRGELRTRIASISLVHDRIHETFGGYEGFLRSCGVRESEISQVRALLLRRFPGRYRMPAEETLVSSAELLHRDIPGPVANTTFFVHAYERPDKVTADLYYMSDKTRDLMARIDENQRNRSFHDHDYVTLEVPLEERGKLFAPVTGELLALSDVDDPYFASGACGAGVAIVPSGNTVYAPAACRVTVQVPTRHAIGVLTQDGIEVLIVVASSTASASRRGFRQHVWQNDSAHRGTPLLSWDPTLVGKDASSPVLMIVTNSSEFSRLDIRDSGSVQVGDEVASISWE
ncbi:tyrosine-protein phosphatase [Olsenella massiliensis]|uniref:tyrosine-protein phosphatase n=1 Tax=Olsenella massiliensis TaxID=1622075 RepID=UPI00071E13F7|nr:tyrosine-protein phosphatase [Olsenella massiliensis]